jgi:hypothetical protein
MIITMKKNCPVIQEVIISLCTINDLLSCSFQLSIFARPVPLTSVSQTIFTHFSSQMHSPRPRLGDIVDSGIGLSYRPGQPMQPGGQVRQPYAGADFILPVRIYEFGYSSQGNLPSELPPTWPLAYLKSKENGMWGREQWGGWSA